MGVFTNKSAIVTGAASGIGRAVSRELARRGAMVVLTDVDAGLLEETTESITGASYRVKAAELDVTDFQAVKELVGETVREHGRLDYIFNNAGIAVIALAEEHTHEDWRKVIGVNLFGVINGVAAAYPVMVEQGCGHIVNTASLAGLIPATGEIAYTTSKYGVVGLSRTLRIEGKENGVKVSVVCPGFIKTPIFQSCKMVNFERDKVIDSIPYVMDADKCAGVILRGVERNRAIIPVTSLAGVMWRMERISPALSSWVIKLTTSKYEDARTDK